MLREVVLLSKNSIQCEKNPLEKILLSLGPIMILGFSKSYVPIILNIIFFVIIHFKNKHFLNIVIKFSLGTAAFAFISSITFLLDYGIEATGLIILKALSGGLCVAYLALTTPMDDILNFLHNSKWLKDFCDIAKSMERFILMLEEELIIMINAVRSRNGFDTFSLKVKNSSKIAGLLFMNTMKRWKDIKDSINSRCYNGNLNYNSHYHKIKRVNIVLIIMYLTLITFTVIKY
ncbi:CbiQ family ECF transporter T component [Clostridium amazonitimonense]|uniref:CbiQ family ECF transporter T component n=1 Tax=Clostridium amazonitimonense TaxID=1499689 RepID=UPI00068AAFAC|nr:CbiQ family ECF transporter T component [Clostridium amazonitimonense]